MGKDNLLGAKVRIRRGWHGGRIGKVTVFDRHRGSASSYVEIKVQLDGSGQVINIPSEEELEKLQESPADKSAGATRSKLLRARGALKEGHS